MSSLPPNKWLFLIKGYETTIRTDLSTDEVIQKIRKNLTPKPTWKDGFSTKKRTGFHGRIYNRTFQVMRQINNRNSFLPRINGKVSKMVNGQTEVKLNFQIIGLVQGFMIFWLGVVGIVFIITFITLFMGGLANWYIVLGPLVMLGFGYGMSYYGFYSECSKAIQQLEKIVAGKEKV